MKKYLILSSIIAFITSLICGNLLFWQFAKEEFDFMDLFSNYRNENTFIIEKYSEKYTIQFDLDNADLQILPSENAQLYGKVYYHKKENIFDIQESENTLIITQKPTTDIQWTFLNIGETTGKVILYVPEQLKGNIIIHGKNGAAEIHNIHAKNLHTTLTNGACSLKSLTVTENISLKSVNGVIETKELSAKTLDIETTNGIIECQGSYSDSIKIKSVNGLLDTKDLYAQTVSLQTKNGAISLKNTKDPDYVISHLITSTSFGNVEIDANYKKHTE